MSIRARQVALLLAAAALLAAGLATGYWWAGRKSGGDADKGMPSAASGDRRVLYWFDPMVPDRHFEKPGKSPFMDMQLVPRYADEATAGGVRIDSGLQQSVGIRVAPVEVGRLPSAVRVPGTLAWDLRRESVVSARIEAVVTHLDVKAPYTNVRRGQPLATLVAPAWSSALAEARALRQGESPAARDLWGASRQRLRTLGIPEEAIEGDGSVRMHSPADGIVTEILAREGAAVGPGAPLLRINSTDTLWLDAAIPQAELAGVVPGTRVRATVSGLPGRSFTGEVETLLPQVDAATLTRRARIVLRNPDGLLTAGQFAEVTFEVATGQAVPLVPTEALISTADDERVILREADGTLRAVRVRAGRRGDGRTEILSGVRGGEQVVVSGQFLVDSEASLSGALQRLGAPAMRDVSQ